MIEKIFKAYDVRATYPSPLNEEAARRVGHATATYLRQQRDAGSLPQVRSPRTVAVGRDMRPHSPSLAKALSDGIRSAGLDVVDVGMIDTSFIYYAINAEDCLGGIQTTASHNPIEYNGFKISGPKAKPIGSGSGLEIIRDIAAAPASAPVSAIGGHVEKDLWPGYKRHVRGFLEIQRPLRVIIDASNGMAGKMIPAIFDDVPNLEIIPFLFEITGRFVHDPNPLVETNLDMLKQQMRQIRPDLGVCFDGDADRCVFLDENGTTVGCDLVTALLAQDFLGKPDNRGRGVVYDLRSTHAVADAIKSAGGVPHRQRVGHAFMKKALAETNSIFGGELSGHFYFADNFFADSGAIAFARVLSVLSAQPRSFSQIVAPLRKYAHSGEINFQVDDKDGKIKELADRYSDARIDYLDGITIDSGQWWFNVRKSNTEPLLRLNLEADSPTLLEEKFEELKRSLGEPAHGH